MTTQLFNLRVPLQSYVSSFEITENDGILKETRPNVYSLEHFSNQCPK